MTHASLVHDRHVYNSDDGGGGGWPRLLGSLVSFTAAASLFSFNQMQHAFSMLTDPRAGIERMTFSIDYVSKAMAADWQASSQRDVDRKINQAVESMVDSTIPAESRLLLENQTAATAGFGRKA